MDRSGIGRRGALGGALGAGLLLARPSLVLGAPAKPRVTIKTNHGVIVVELEDKKAPITSANFLRYVDAMKYDGGLFYRASRTPGVKGAGTIQGGPNPATRHFAPIAHESTTVTGLKHKAGTISLTRLDPGTASSDFFICATPEPYLDAHPGAPGDNQGFAAFGHVVSGMDVVLAILALPSGGKTEFPAMKGQILTRPCLS